MPEDDDTIEQVMTAMMEIGVNIAHAHYQKILHGYGPVPLDRCVEVVR